ncbi:hypothetical protein LSCM1_02422 [Leishmania martiniquensis]|uniref:Uncharacterized protein n=1 Tax=Leishmania martiniquensis TaxID=1580590 RepID=A0A836KDH0_9TRYP|nr:hypothetical protein LSCM1_02422 [Leishmania martiniquensis]
MSLDGKRRSLQGGVRRGLYCLLWVVFLSAAWTGFHARQTMRITPTAGRGSTVDSDVIDCLPANLSVEVTSVVLNAFIKVAVLPMINEGNSTLIVPAQLLNHVWVDEMLLRHFRLESLNVSTSVPDARGIALHATGLGLEVEHSRFAFSYMGVQCNGTFWATLNETAVDAALYIEVTPEGHWSVTFPRLEVYWGQLAVHHELESKACNIAQKLIEVFTGQLDIFVAEKVKKQLAEDAPSHVAAGLNKAFASVNIRAITPPVMTADTMAVTLDLNPADLGCALEPLASTVPDILPRDAGVRTTVTSLNNALYNAVQAQRLRVERTLPAEWNTSLFEDIIPALYKACPNCYMYTLAQATKAPALHVPHHGEVLVVVPNVLLGLYVQPNTTQQAEALSLLLKKSNNRSSVEFADVYRYFGVREVSTQRHGKPFPVLAIRCSLAFGIRNISADSGRSVSYEILPVHDVAVEVEASNVGDVSARELEGVITKVWNNFAAPMANGNSPLKLPFFLGKAVLEVEAEDIQAGVDVALQGLLQDVRLKQ